MKATDEKNRIGIRIKMSRIHNTASNRLDFHIRIQKEKKKCTQKWAQNKTVTAVVWFHLDLFYIERGFHSRTEIGEREIDGSTVHIMGAVENKTLFGCLPLPPSPSDLIRGVCWISQSACFLADARISQSACFLAKAGISQSAWFFLAAIFVHISVFYFSAFFIKYAPTFNWRNYFWPLGLRFIL